MSLKFTIQTKIQKPIAEVFDAVYDPDKLSGYFTNGGSTGPLDEGTAVKWTFADTPGQKPHVGDVTITRTVKNECIEFDWQGGKELTHAVIEFEAASDVETIIRITESGWDESDEADRSRSYGNCMGWSQMVFALKAYCEYGINLRKGAYSGLYGS